MLERNLLTQAEQVSPGYSGDEDMEDCIQYKGSEQSNQTPLQNKRIQRNILTSNQKDSNKLIKTEGNPSNIFSDHIDSPLEREFKSTQEEIIETHTDKVKSNPVPFVYESDNNLKESAAQYSVYYSEEEKVKNVSFGRDFSKQEDHSTQKKLKKVIVISKNAKRNQKNQKKLLDSSQNNKNSLEVSKSSKEFRIRRKSNSRANKFNNTFCKQLKSHLFAFIKHMLSLFLIFIKV